MVLIERLLISSLRCLNKWIIAIWEFLLCTSTKLVFPGHITAGRLASGGVTSVLTLHVCVLYWGLGIRSHWICGFSFVGWVFQSLVVIAPSGSQPNAAAVESLVESGFCRLVGVTEECRWARRNGWVPAKCGGCGVPGREWFWASAKCGSCGSRVESCSACLWNVTKERRWDKRNGWKGQWERIRGTLGYESKPKGYGAGLGAGAPGITFINKNFYKHPRNWHTLPTSQKTSQAPLF